MKNEKKVEDNSRFHSIKIDTPVCIGCVTCMKVCPTKAIRVGRKRKAVIDYHRCIDCGECFRACPHGAVIPITTTTSDLKKFKYNVALPSPVLYSQFGQSDMPNEILSVLRSLGFDDVYDETLMCEMTSIAIKEYLVDHVDHIDYIQRPIPGPLISSACPVVVRLIQGLFPGLCELIIPIEPPREIGAKNLREEISRKLGIPQKDIGIFHITTCAAKMVSINYPASMERSYLNGAISIREIYNAMAMKLKKTVSPRMIQTQSPISGIGMGWALPGGEVRSAKRHTVAVSGVRDTIKILQDVEAGKLKDISYLECLICPDGCINGPLTVDNRFIAKSKIQRLIRMYGGKHTVDAFTVKRMYQEGFFSFKRKVEPRPFLPLDVDRVKALQKLKLKEKMIEKLPGIDCGVCGAPDCETLADDIARGRAVIGNCRFFTSGTTGKNKNKGNKKRIIRE